MVSLSNLEEVLKAGPKIEGHCNEVFLKSSWFLNKILYSAFGKN